MPLMYLSRRDKKLLEDFFKQMRKRAPFSNTPSRPDAEPSYGDQEWLPPEVYVGKAKTVISGMTLPGAGTGTGGCLFDSPGNGDCDVFRVLKESGCGDNDDALEDVNFDREKVLNISSAPIAKDSYNIILRDKFGRWFAIPTAVGIDLVECCLTVDHPGRGIPFSVYVGTWNAGTNEWDYGCEGGTGTGTGTGTSSVGAMAIDWRYGTPYPPAGARGLFVARNSTGYTTIYECVSLDCVSPGECCPLTGTGS